MVLALALAFSFSTVAFAAEESGIPENATRHTIELTVEPGESFDGSNSGITPFMWNQGSYNPPANGTTYTATFTADHRYLAYEISAIGTSGSAVAGNCTVQLIDHDSMAPIAATYVSCNGSIEKMDWIDVYTGDKYLFKIMNSTSSAITVTVTYYTWA